MKLTGRVINGGDVEGTAVVLDVPFSFIGDFNPGTGTLTMAGHPLNGQSIAGRILICPSGKGGTIAPFIAYRAKKAGKAPAAILCEKADPILCECALVMDIPMLDGFERSPVGSIETGRQVAIAGREVSIDES